MQTKTYNMIEINRPYTHAITEHIYKFSEFTISKNGYYVEGKALKRFRSSTVEEYGTFILEITMLLPFTHQNYEIF